MAELLWKISWTKPEDEKEYSRPYIEESRDDSFGNVTSIGWHGRYNIQTKRASVVAPADEPWRSMTVPDGVIKMLKEKYGQDTEVWHFQMDGTVKRVA